MLARRIIPCLDVRDGRVVKGVQFRNHIDVGDIIDLAMRYRDEGADELVFYDITASVDDRTVSPEWIGKVSAALDIPFDAFGRQCVVVGIDSFDDGSVYRVKSHTGDETKTRETGRETLAWVKEAVTRGAGEIVLNCMNQDGVRKGYDIAQLKAVRAVCDVPLIASGGAGATDHFEDVFKQADVDGALAASVFHKAVIAIPDLKKSLKDSGIEMRL